jgi:D-hydroxyproline dehydrogenase subunit alpha
MRHTFDVVVVGSGPAGMAAACCAAEQGKRVAMVDDNFRPGGQIWRGAEPGAKLTGLHRTWRGRLGASSVVVFPNHRVFDAPAKGILATETENRLVEFGYDQLILATGARELFLPFPGWTLPNVMGVGGLQAMAKSGLSLAGKKVAICGSGPLLLAVGAHLKEGGAKVVAICEQAPWARLAAFAATLAAQPSRLVQGLGYRMQLLPTSYQMGTWPVTAKGDTQVRSVVVTNGTRQREIECDYLACGFHLVPNIELAMLLGCELAGGAVAVDSLQRSSVENVSCAGESTGIGGVELALLEGQIAGLAAAGNLSAAQAMANRRAPYAKFAAHLARAFALRQELKSLAEAATIVCRCEDVTCGAVFVHDSWRSAKLQTRCGMGPCQGRICGAALDFLKGWKPDSVRPPLFPVNLSSLLQSEAFHENQQHPTEEIV